MTLIEVVFAAALFVFSGASATNAWYTAATSQVHVTQTQAIADSADFAAESWLSSGQFPPMVASGGFAIHLEVRAHGDMAGIPVEITATSNNEQQTLWMVTEEP